MTARWLPYWDESDPALALVPLNDASGTTPRDLSGNLSPGLFNSPSWDTVEGGIFGPTRPFRVGLPGSALILNGVNQGLEIDGLLDTFPTEGSIDFWYYLTSDAPDSAPLFNRLTRQGSGDFNLLDAIFVSGRIRFRVFRANALVATIDTKSNALNRANRWRHANLVWSSSGYEARVDGLREGGAASSQTPLAKDNTGNAGFFLGSYFDSTPTSRFTAGKFWGLRVLPRALTRQECASAYYQSPPPGAAYPAARLVPRSTAATVSSTNTAEAVLRYDAVSGKYRLWRQDGGVLVYQERAGLNGPWSSLVTVLGGGVGGEPGSVFQPNLLDDSGSTYCHYVNSGTSNLQVAVSTDGGRTFTKAGSPACVISTVPGSSGHANSWAARVGNTYHFLLESKTASDGIYRGHHLTATSPLGPLTYDAALTDLERGTGTQGGFEGEIRDDGAIRILYHASTDSNNTPYPTLWTSVYGAVSYDWRHWQQIPGPVSFPTDEAYAESQRADPTFCFAPDGMHYIEDRINSGQTVFELVEFTSPALSLKDLFAVTVPDLSAQTRAAVLDAMASVNPNVAASGSLMSRLDGVKLASDGLDSVSTSSPSGSPSGWNFRQKLMWMFRRSARANYDSNAGTMTVKDENGNVISTQSATTNGGVQATGELT